MLETIAVGAVCAVAGAAVSVVAMRHNLASDRAELAAVAAEQDHRDELQNARYYELADWSDDLGVEEDRLAQWDAFYRAQFGTEPDTVGSTVEEEDVEVPVNRSRFAYQPETVRVTSDEIFHAAGVADIFAAVMAEPTHGTNLGDEPLPILADTRAAHLRRMERTGAFPVLPNPDQPADPQQPSGPPKPKLIGQPRVPAEVLHAMWDAAQRADRPGTSTDMPVPTPPPTNPAVAVAR